MTCTYCPHCGGQVAPLRCDHCGEKSIQPGAKFCSSCGKPHPGIDPASLELVEPETESQPQPQPLTCEASKWAGCRIHVHPDQHAWIIAEAKRSKMGRGVYIASMIEDYEDELWAAQSLDGPSEILSFDMDAEAKARFKDRCHARRLDMSSVLRWMLWREMAACGEGS